jgi:hypothetical protein
LGAHLKRIDVVRTLETQWLVLDQPAFWRWFNVYFRPAAPLLAVSLVYFLFFQVLIGAVLLTASLLVAWRASRILRMHRIDLPRASPERRVAAVAATRALGWWVERDEASCLHAEARESWWVPRRWVVVVYGEAFLLFCSIPRSYSTFTSLPAHDLEAFKSALVRQFNKGTA